MNLNRYPFPLGLIFLVFIFAYPAHAGIFGNSQLGVIKQSANVYRFIAPDGETINESTLLYQAARTAKILGYSHFLFVKPPEKKAQKPKSATSENGGTQSAEVTDEPKPLTSVLVYFYNGPRKQFGVSTIAVTDVFPEDAEPAPAPVEKQTAPKPEVKPADTAVEAPPKQTKKKAEPVNDPAPVVVEDAAPLKAEPKQPKKKVDPAVEQAPVVVEEVPQPKPEPKKVEKQKIEPAPAPADVEEVPEPKPELAPAAAPETKKNLSIENTLGVQQKKPKAIIEAAPLPVVPPETDQQSSETATTTAAQAPKKKKRILLEEEIKKPEVGDKFE